MPLSPNHPFSWKAGRPGHPVPLSPVEFYAQPIACAPCCALPPRILEPATTCSVFAWPSFAQHQLCDSLSDPTYHTSLSLYYLLYPCTGWPGPFLSCARSWNFVCVAQQHLLPRASKEGRVHCIALPGCNAPRIAVQRGGGGIRAMQNAVFYCGVELSRAWHCKEGREGGGRW